MKFVPADMKGIGFLMSFAIGASLVTLGLWVVRFLYLYQQKQYSWRAAYHALPSFHFQQMWLPGCCSGLLWSFGNLCSFVSVYHLGQGVGYSVTQAAMIGTCKVNQRPVTYWIVSSGRTTYSPLTAVRCHVQLSR